MAVAPDLEMSEMESASIEANVEHDGAAEGQDAEQSPGIVDWYSPILVALVGIALLIPSMQLGVGTLNHPGVGLWPTINAVLLISMAPLMLLARHRFQLPTRRGLANVLGIAVPLLIFVPLYSWMGLIGAGAVAMFIIAKWVGKMTWLGALITTILVPTSVYLVFAVALGVNLRAF